MSATTIEKVYAPATGGNDKAVELNNTEITRPLLMGTSWTHLAIAIRADVSTEVDVTVPAPGFCLGMCSSAGGRLTTPTGHWVGYVAGYGGGRTLGVSSTSSEMRASFSTAYTELERVQAGSLTSAAWTRGSGTYFATVGGVNGSPATDAYPVPLIISLRKSGGSMYVDAVVSASSAYNSVAVSEETLVAALQTRSMLNVESFLLDYGANRFEYDPGASITVDEATYGDLDHVALCWPCSALPLNIYSFLVCKWE